MSYDIGEEGSVSRHYYNLCIQAFGSQRRDRMEDVCGCQAEIIHEQGIYVARKPHSADFVACAQNQSPRQQSNSLSNSEITESTSRPIRSLPILPILLVAGTLVGGALIFSLLSNQEED